MRGARHAVATVIVASVFGLCVPTTAHAQLRRVGVVVSLRVNVSETLADRMAGAMAAQLQSRLKVTAIGGAAAKAKLKAPLPETCVAEPACAARIGRDLGVDEILFVAVISLSANAVQLDVTSVAVVNGAAQGRDMLEVNPNDPAAKMAAHVRKWLPGASERPKPKAAPVQTTTTATTALALQPAASQNDAQAEGLQISTPVWIAGASTVAALGLGTTFALLARSEFRDLEDTCPETCDKGSLRTKNVLADAFFAASAVGAGLTVFFLLTTDAEESQVPVSLTGAPGQIAVTFSGGF